jgi:hypothetical protein
MKKKQEEHDDAASARGCLPPEAGVMVIMATAGHLHLRVACPNNPDAIRYTAQELELMADELRAQAARAEELLPWTLYWVSHADHDEDEFWVARSIAEAEEEFVQNYGMDPGDAMAERLTVVPDGAWPHLYCATPDDDVLERCGVTKTPLNRGGEAWQFEGRVFMPGDVENAAEAVVDPRSTN